MSGRRLMVSRGEPSRSIAAIAGEQRGRISRNQLRAAGVSPRMLRTALANGELHRVHHGVYAVGHLARIERGRETAALLAVGPSAVLVALTALELLGVVPADPGRPVHVARMDGRKSDSQPGIEVHRYSRLLANQIQLREGLPVTNAERALLDAAPLLTPRQLERAFDEAVALRASSRTKVLQLLRATNGRIGQQRLAALADPHRRPTRTQSSAEESALQLIRAAQLPEPIAQCGLHGFTADFYWPEAQVVLEVDGFHVHGMVRTNFVRDRRKDRVFRDQGLHVVRVAAEELHDQPLQIVAHLSRTITERTLPRSG